MSTPTDQMHSRAERSVVAVRNTSLLGSALGAQLIVSLSNQVVNVLVLLFICLGVVASSRTEKRRKTKRGKAAGSRSVLPILSGFLLGLYIGMLGIASALVAISVLMFLFDLDILQANGTAKMIIFMNNLIASITYTLNGQVDFFLGALLAVPIALGSLLGAKTALKLGSTKLRFVFILMAVLTMAKLVSETF